MASKWLRREKELQLYIHESAGSVLQLIGSEQPKRIDIKLKAYQTDGKKEFPHQIKKIEYNGNFELISANSIISHKNGDFITFALRLATLKDCILHFDINEIGEASIPCLMFEKLYGNIKVPVWNKQKDVIGIINVHYLIIEPWENGVKMKVEDIDVPHWNPFHNQPSSRALEMGHRGCGSTNGQPSSIGTPTENTIASFHLALEKGADYVEFDVHLSKDSHPVVFHDFHVAIKANKHVGPHGKLLIPINELSLAEMSNTKLLLSNDSVDNNEEEEYMSLFPSLEKNGIWEADFLPDKNQLVDRILDVVYTHGKSRRIIFGSFDPDICVMLKLKQPKYPVMLITAGLNDTWPLLRDLRCRNFEVAVGFAKGLGLMGISVYADALKERIVEFSDYVKQNGLELLTWGDSNTNERFRSLQRNSKVTGIIYDRLHEANKEIR